jgi:hypothetical protein
MENLSEDLRGDEGLKKFPTVEELAKSYKNLEAFKGNSIRIAGPDASEEERSAIYQKVMKHMPELMLKPNPEAPEQMREFHAMLGVPDDISGYEYDGTNLTPEMVAEFKMAAKEADMTKAQWKKQIKIWDEMGAATQQQKEEARTRMGAELKGEWGMAFEDRYHVVEKFIEENPGLGNIDSMSPEQIKTYYNLSKSLLQQPQTGTQPPPRGAITPEEARAQIAEIKNNPAFMSTNPAHRQEHQRLMKKHIELLKMSDPQKYG